MRALRSYAPFERARGIGWEDMQKSPQKRAFLYGAPGTIRTCDPLVRSQVLYPAELRVRADLVIYRRQGRPQNQGRVL